MHKSHRDVNRNPSAYCRSTRVLFLVYNLLNGIRKPRISEWLYTSADFSYIVADNNVPRRVGILATAELLFKEKQSKHNDLL